MSQELIDQISPIFVFNNPLLFRGDACFLMWGDYLTTVVQTIYKETFPVFFTKPWLSSMISSHQLSEPWSLLLTPRNTHTQQAERAVQKYVAYGQTDMGLNSIWTPCM